MTFVNLQPEDNGSVSRGKLNDNFDDAQDQIDTIVAAGVPLATTTVFGRSKLSVAPVDAADPIAVGDNDPRLSVIEISSGFINLWATSTAPTGWLLCQGQAVSRTTYADLFAVLSTTYGVGDGSTTFNLPNLQGRVPVGFDSTQTEFDALGETGGAKIHTLTTAQIPAHTHTVADYSNSSGSSTFLAPFDTSSTGPNNTYTTSSVGGGEAHNNLQPYITLNYIIKT